MPRTASKPNLVIIRQSSLLNYASPRIPQPTISQLPQRDLLLKVMEYSLLNSIKDTEVLHDLKILRLVLIQLIRVLAWLERVGSHGIHRSHLGGHLVSS